MDDTAERIETLTRRLALLERRMADETAAIRSELAALQGYEPAPIPMSVAPSVAPRPERKTRDLSWLAGPTGLALAGGAVTLLGIVFVFALAASRGWIGPAVRCTIGGGVSVSLVGASLIVRRRYGHVVAALAAAGAGIGGSYVTLYAASRGYHLLGHGAAWAAVVAVAAVAVWLALAWKTQLLAVLGLVTVVIAPPTVEGHLSALGLGASVIAAAAALGLGAQRAWRTLAGLSYGLLFAQAVVYVFHARHSELFDESGYVGTWHHRGAATLVALAVIALALVGAAAYRRRARALEGFTSALAGSSLPLSLLAVWELLEGSNARGTALVTLAVVYAFSAAATFSVKQRDLAVLLGALGLFAAALATATFLSNGGLLVAWTLEGVTLIAVARRLGRSSFLLAGVAYLAAAAVHLFSFETPLRHLFAEQAHPATHLGQLIFFGAAVAVIAALLRGQKLLAERLDLAAAGAAALLGVFAASLFLLDLSQRLGGGDLHARFQRGETMVSALWALVALTLLAAGLARGLKEVRFAGLGLLGLALAKLFIFDLSRLSSLTRATSFLAVGIALLAGGFLVQRLAERRPGGFGT